MGEFRRVVHQGGTIISVEHRADEYQKGVAAYTDDNLMLQHTGMDWFVADVAVLHDVEGLIPWDALFVNNPTDIQSRRAVLVDATIRDIERQKTKDRTKGAGGRLDDLYQNLRDGTMTDSERDEMLKLERSL